jgi:gamma-glutamyltranspeptidase / glutathione hydrolase
MGRGGDGAGRGRRLLPLAELGQAGPGAGAGPGDPLRRRGRAGRAPRGPRLGRDAACCQGRGARHYIPDRRHGPRLGEVFRAPGQAEVLRRIAAQGRAGSTRARWPRTWSPACAPWAGPTRWRISPPPPATTPPRCRGPLPRDRPGRASAERPGRDRLLLLNILERFDLAAMDPFGSERAASRGRGDQACLRRARPLHRRPAARRRGWPHAGARDGGAKLAALIDPARALPAAAADRGGPPRHHLSVRRGPRRDGGVADLFGLHSFGSGFASEGSASTSRTAGPALPWPRATRTRPGRQAADAHDHPGMPPRGGAS